MSALCILMVLKESMAGPGNLWLAIVILMYYKAMHILALVYDMFMVLFTNFMHASACPLH